MANKASLETLPRPQLLFGQIKRTLPPLTLIKEDVFLRPGSSILSGEATNSKGEVHPRPLPRTDDCDNGKEIHGTSIKTEPTWDRLQRVSQTVSPLRTPFHIYVVEFSASAEHSHYYVPKLCLYLFPPLPTPIPVLSFVTKGALPLIYNAEISAHSSSVCTTD